MSEPEKPLRKIAEIEILGQRYDLARNGRFALVEPREDDAYGRPVSREINLRQWLNSKDTVEKFQALLDLLGESVTKLQAVGDLRRGQIGESKGEGV